MQRWREQYLGLAEFLPAMAIAEVDQFFTLSRDELAAEVRVTAATFSDMEWFQKSGAKSPRRTPHTERRC
jgi:hypothetical protein